MKNLRKVQGVSETESAQKTHKTTSRFWILAPLCASRRNVAKILTSRRHFLQSDCCRRYIPSYVTAQDAILQLFFQAFPPQEIFCSGISLVLHQKLCLATRDLFLTKFLACFITSLRHFLHRMTKKIVSSYKMLAFCSCQKLFLLCKLSPQTKSLKFSSLS